jgi:methylamine dehydrogenase heavy chain
LLAPEDMAAHWRPGGWQPVTSDGSKLLYVLMQPDAREGTYKDPGTEIWIFDAVKKTRVKRLRLVRPGASIALTHAAEPLLLVQGGERVDVYDASTGSVIRSLNMTGFKNHIFIQPAP